jgi:hypothetical protein
MIVGYLKELCAGLHLTHTGSSVSDSKILNKRLGPGSKVCNALSKRAEAWQKFRDPAESVIGVTGCRQEPDFDGEMVHLGLSQLRATLSVQPGQNPPWRI